MKVLVGFLVFILLIVLSVMGSCVYIGYRAKKKADEIQQAYKANDLNKLAGALGVGNSSGASGSSHGIFERNGGERFGRRIVCCRFRSPPGCLRRPALNPEQKFLYVPDSRW